MNKLRNRPFAVFVGVSGLAIMLSAYFLTLFGVVDFSDSDFLGSGPHLQLVVHYGLFSLNMAFASKICLGHKWGSAILFGVAYVAMQSPLNAILGAPLFLSGVLPGIAIVALGAATKRGVVRTLIKYAVFSVAVLLFQSATLFVESRFSGIIYTGMPWMNTVILSIDLFLLYIFLVGVMENGLDWKSLAVPEKVGVSVDEETGEEDLSHRQKAIFMTMVMGFQLVQLLVVLSIGHLNNMLTELAVMLILFWVGRKILGVSYHGSSLWWCSTVAFGTFYVMTKVTPPFEVSLFSVIAASSLLAYVLHVVAVKQAWIEFYERKYETDFTRYGLSHEMAAFAYDYKVSGLSIKEQMAKTGLGEQTVKNYRTKVNRALTSTQNDSKI